MNKNDTALSLLIDWQSTDTFSNCNLDDVAFGKSGRLVHLVPFVIGAKAVLNPRI